MLSCQCLLCRRCFLLSGSLFLGQLVLSGMVQWCRLCSETGGQFPHINIKRGSYSDFRREGKQKNSKNSLFGFFGCLYFCCPVLVHRRKINTLKPSYFVSGVVGLFVGFPQHKRVVDGYARCLMCKVDISNASRGLNNLWGHWKGIEHKQLEQKYRIMTQRPLLEKS